MDQLSSSRDFNAEGPASTRGARGVDTAPSSPVEYDSEDYCDDTTEVTATRGYANGQQSQEESAVAGARGGPPQNVTHGSAFARLPLSEQARTSASQQIPFTQSAPPITSSLPCGDFRRTTSNSVGPGAGATTPTPHQPPDVTGRDSCEWPPEPTALYDADDIARIPACIREAVLQFRPTQTCTPMPLPRSHRSITFQYGVRVKCWFRESLVVGWLCMASDACRRDITFLPFHGGKTTNATKHLWETHQIQSEKTALQNTRKRDRAEEVNCILASALCRDDAKRLCLLLETIRIVYNNLPFRFGEYEESVILKEVVTKDEFKTTVNSRTVTHSLVELYASGRQELIGFIRDNRLGLIKCLTMDVDFWTPKHGGEKYLGLRIYFVDSHFRLRTVLLGTRHFLPMYGERDQGFAALLSGGFVVFCLTLACPRATSSAPPLTAAPTLNGLKWEWCIPHMVNAATKMACGLARKSHNPEMSELLNKLSQTVYGTSTNSTLGDLLPMLMIMLGEGNGTQLVGYKPHRFMGMAATMERVLEKWPALEAWYEARSAQHARKKKRAPPGFHLAGCQQHLVQLLSILTPILLVTKRSQAQDTNQVQVLLSLYTMRMTSLALDSPIRLYDTAPTNAVNIHPFQLTSLVARTGMLLQKAFYHNFFRRYVDADYIASGSYIFEMQLVMHPSVKHVGSPMDEVIAAVARTEGRMRDDLVAGHVVAVQAAILKRLKSLMRLVANSQDPAPVDPIAAPAVQANVF